MYNRFFLKSVTVCILSLSVLASFAFYHLNSQGTTGKCALDSVHARLFFRLKLSLINLHGYLTGHGGWACLVCKSSRVPGQGFPEGGKGDAYSMLM